MEDTVTASASPDDVAESMKTDEGDNPTAPVNDMAVDAT